MVETFRDKLLCTGKGPIAELTKPYPNMFVWRPRVLELFGKLFRLGIVESWSVPHERYVFFLLIWVEESETRGKKYNLVAKAFFSWVSFLKKSFEILGYEHCIRQEVVPPPKRKLM